MSKTDLKNRIRHHLSGLSFRIISMTVLLLLLFGAMQSVIGYLQFTGSFTNEYNDSAFRTAETAATLVNGDHIEDYLKTGGDSDEYRQMAGRLDILCQKQNVTLIYIIAVDRSDYGRFTNVISVQNKNSGYDPWPIGHQHDTTNDEYRGIYRDIYEIPVFEKAFCTAHEKSNQRGRAFCQGEYQGEVTVINLWKESE